MLCAQTDYALSRISLDTATEGGASAAREGPGQFIDNSGSLNLFRIGPGDLPQ